MTQTERTITACPINLIGTNNSRVMTMTPSIGQHLSLLILCFVIGVAA